MHCALSRSVVGAFLASLWYAPELRHCQSLYFVYFCTTLLGRNKNKKSLAMTYSPAVSSTIGAEGLNFRVRHGNGWFPFAIVTRLIIHKLQKEADSSSLTCCTAQDD